MLFTRMIGIATVKLITAADKQIIGQALPKFIGGFTNNSAGIINSFDARAYSFPSKPGIKYTTQKPRLRRKRRYTL